MSLPTPNTRKEQYLNAIATGNTVNMPAKPITREEAYLEAIAKNGGGSGGAENYAQLSGKPQINNVELASGNNSLSALGIQGKLTFDNVPTDGSNNPVKSNGIYDSEKDIYAVMGQMGAKNLLIYPYYEEDTKTHRGVTYTVNADNTISLSGTADGGTSNYILHPSSQNIKYPAGTYVLSGCPAGGARNTYWMQLAHGGTVDTFDLGEGASVTLDSEQVVGIGFYVANGVDVTGKIVKPMLRLASDTDNTYQPYAKTNKQLTDEIANKVDKVEGKGLSTNDYTNTDKAEVAKVANKADKTATASGETLALVPTSEGRALLHTAYGMSTQSGTPTPSSPVDIESAKVNLTSTHGQDSQNVTTDLTLRAIEVTSSDDYNLVRDGKYYIADTLDYSEDNGFVVTRRIGHDVIDGSTLPVVYSGVDRQAQVFYIDETRVMPKKDTNPVISDRFQKVSGLPPMGGNGYIRNTGSNNLRIYIYTTDYTTENDFNAFFAQNNTNVDFILATPTTESITTEQALALLSLKTYDESTSISSQAEPSCTVAIEYAKERLGALTLIAHNLAKGNDLRIAELEETP